ncbi:MAG TPA: shikimate dehydrogenase [Actinomycetota bacterium]|nr:shikimate dehydrogenase [Actinomycetota bacterium]
MDEPVAPRIGGRTRLAGVIGWPVSGSLSPVIHNAAFAALGLDWAYVPLPVPPGRVAEAIAGLRALGFAGANVTMPYKTEATQAVERLSEDAALLEAVNTVVVGGDEIEGANTDAPGFDRVLRSDAGFDPSGRRALVFGAGGAARACVLALGRAGLAELVVAIREPERSTSLARLARELPVELRVIPLADAASESVDLVVNATPLGRTGETLPHPELHDGVLVVDLLYRPAVTPLLQAARDAGAAAYGGLGLLLHQAALSFELWTGLEPPMPVMSAAAVAELTDVPGD